MIDLRVVSREEQSEILGDNPIKMEWGWFMPKQVEAGVSARMIIDSCCLSYLGDRISRVGSNQDLDKAAGQKCIDIKLADTLYSFMQENGIRSDSNKIIFGEVEGYQMLATPNGSYGYVYMSFWAV